MSNYSSSTRQLSTCWKLSQWQELSSTEHIPKAAHATGSVAGSPLPLHCQPALSLQAQPQHCNGAAALITQVTAVPHQTCRNESLPKKIRSDIAELWKNTRLLSQQFYTAIQDMKNPHDCVYFHRNYDTEWVSTFTYSPEFNATVLTILSNLLSQR